MDIIKGMAHNHINQRKCGTIRQQAAKNGFEVTKCRTNSVFAWAA